jgi:elongation factor Ts
MAVTAEMVKDLRERTGAGMMDAKKALDENGGDMEKAIDWLRQKGVSKAAKKSGRVTAEGAVAALSDGTTGVVVEINCETDFTGRNENFTGFVKQVAEAAMAAKAGDVETIKGLKLASGKTVGDALTELVSTTGENMTIRRAAKLTVDNGIVGSYVHLGGKIGVLVAIEGTTDATVAKQVSMHVAASNPQALDKSSIDPALLERERAIYVAQAAESGKPANVVEKIVEGRVNKYLEEVCLVEQPFVMDPDRKVGKVVSDAAAGAKVTGFVRFGLGDGVEKVQEDFAAEVAKVANA